MNPQSPAVVAAFLVSGAGVTGLLRAGRIEADGQLAEARAVARRSGFVAAAGSVAVATLVVLRPIPVGSRLAIIALAIACGATSLLAGLSGKPRPSAGFATGLLAAAAIVLVVAS